MLYFEQILLYFEQMLLYFYNCCCIFVNCCCILNKCCCILNKCCCILNKCCCILNKCCCILNKCCRIFLQFLWVIVVFLTSPLRCYYILHNCYCIWCYISKRYKIVIIIYKYRHLYIHYEQKIVATDNFLFHGYYISGSFYHWSRREIR